MDHSKFTENTTKNARLLDRSELLFEVSAIWFEASSKAGKKYFSSSWDQHNWNSVGGAFHARRVRGQSCSILVSQGDHEIHNTKRAFVQIFIFEDSQAFSITSTESTSSNSLVVKQLCLMMKRRAVAVRGDSDFFHVGPRAGFLPMEQSTGVRNFDSWWLKTFHLPETGPRTDRCEVSCFSFRHCRLNSQCIENQRSEYNDLSHLIWSGRQQGLLGLLWACRHNDLSDLLIHWIVSGSSHENMPASEYRRSESWQKP